MSPFYDSLPPQSHAAENLPATVVPYSNLPEHSDGVFPTAFYEYVYRKGLLLPQALISRYQCFVMILFPCPIVGFHLDTGESEQIMAAILCEEVDGDAESLLPAVDLIAAGGKLTSVTGWLCPSHDEARCMWLDFVAPLPVDDLDDEEDS